MYFYIFRIILQLAVSKEQDKQNQKCYLIVEARFGCFKVSRAPWMEIQGEKTSGVMYYGRNPQVCPAERCRKLCRGGACDLALALGQGWWQGWWDPEQKVAGRPAGGHAKSGDADRQWDQKNTDCIARQFNPKVTCPPSIVNRFPTNSHLLP